MTLCGAAALNAPLLGLPGGRRQIETPALVLDQAAFEANLSVLASIARQHGMGLRPHAKSHKSGRIAQAQLAHGAPGIACAKPGELLALHEAGVDALMLTAPVASGRKIDALARAAAAGCKLSVVVDRADLAGVYGQAARRHGAVLDVLLDLDVGLRRTGLDSPEAAVALARIVSNEDGLRYAGVQAYAGHIQHIQGFGARADANGRAMACLAGQLSALRNAGLPPGIVSGGGTGSHLLDCQAGVLTEVQAGSYIFMDEGYLPVDLHGTGSAVFAASLFVAVTVVAHSAAGFAITDGGSKSFALDGPPPQVFRDGERIGVIEWCGDEFGRVLPAAGHGAPPIAARLECTVPHCDPTVNLHDVYHLCRGDQLVAFWPVDARGRAD